MPGNAAPIGGTFWQHYDVIVTSVVKLNVVFTTDIPYLDHEYTPIFELWQQYDGRLAEEPQTVKVLAAQHPELQPEFEVHQLPKFVWYDYKAVEVAQFQLQLNEPTIIF